MLQSLRIPILLPIGWLVIATILFCLPGKALPSANWMSELHVDKWIHVGIFTLLSFFWGNSLRLAGQKQKWVLWLAALFYGVLIEIVQDQFIAFRSFDVWDIAADGAGAALGLWVYKK